MIFLFYIYQRGAVSIEMSTGKVKGLSLGMELSRTKL